jgi:SAM-dependent methyltransferase
VTVLDVGCGQGDLARVMMTNHAYRWTHRSGSPAGPLRYIGLDRSHESLGLAEHHLQSFARELITTFGRTVSASQLVETSWLRFDWDSPLPFTDGSIERILYHLSLPFAPSPLHCLRQALRVLQPDGTLVVTCFQPYTDLSLLLRRHLYATGQDEFSAPAQIVLHYLGRLREALRHGLLHSFQRNELFRLLAHAGAQPVRVAPILEGQFLLAVVRKAKSAG